MGCTIQDVLLYLKDIVMLIRNLMFKTQNPKWLCVYIGRSNSLMEILKQTVIAKSTMEYEFIALINVGKRLNGYATS